MDKIFQNLRNVTFISSESCNLNCEYCEIAKNSSSTHAEEVKKIKESLMSGSYLARYKQFFKRFDIDTSQIIKIELWGQEPTLTLDEFTTQIEEIFKWLPNLKYMFFSTNGVAYSDKILNLIKTINKTIKKLSIPQEFTLSIQFSFDGLKDTEIKRGVKFTTIFNNLKYILTELNQLEIEKNFKINIMCHGVLTLDIIKDGFSNGIENFWSEIDEIMKDIYFTSTNNQIIINRRFSFGLQMPYNSSKEEGQLLAKYCKYCMENPFMNLNFDMLHPIELIGLYHNPINECLKNNDFNSDIIKVANYNYYNNDLDGIKYLYESVGCNAGKNDVKMRYNGQIIYCQNIIFNLNEKDFNTNKVGAEYDIQRIQMKNNFCPNLLTDSKEKIEKYLLILNGYEHKSFGFSESLYVNLLLLLSKYNQIDKSYKNDYAKILRHAGYLSRINQCWYNNLVESGSFYARSLGFIRYFCNGLLDLVEQKGYIEKQRYEN